MTTDIEWQNLRSLRGSVHSAFEELCCQLAHCEKPPEGDSFTRKGTPDAGVECFWSLPNGDEWAWQAKYFLSPPGPVQWRQLDESVKTALEKHPKLTRYTVCLPLDRADPRLEEKHHFQDAWDESVRRWEEWAADRKMAVQFDYWGQHELLLRLSHADHAGRYLFWFDRDLLSRTWFKHQVEEAIDNAGPRYTPELNVELPISRVFDGLGVTSDFHVPLARLRSRLRRAYSALRDFGPELNDSIQPARERFKQLWGTLESASVTFYSF